MALDQGFWQTSPAAADLYLIYSAAIIYESTRICISDYAYMETMASHLDHYLLGLELRLKLWLKIENLRDLSGLDKGSFPSQGSAISPELAFL